MSWARKLSLPPNLTAARFARTWACDQLAPEGFDEVTVENVLLAISELVTNAVMHTGSAPTLTIRVDRDGICVEVTDSSPTDPAIVLEPGPTGGWGMRVVDSISDRWGTSDKTAGGKVVWFTVAAA